MADPLSYVICEKSLDENSEYVYIQERNVIAIIFIFRNKSYYYTHTDAYTQNIYMSTHISKSNLAAEYHSWHTHRS